MAADLLYKVNEYNNQSRDIPTVKFDSRFTFLLFLLSPTSFMCMSVRGIMFSAGFVAKYTICNRYVFFLAYYTYAENTRDGDISSKNQVSL